MTGLLFAAALVSMTPDYAGIAVPPNVAPLNFDLDRDAEVVLAGPDGASLAKRGRNIRFGLSEWRGFLGACRGKEYVISVKPLDGGAPLVATNAVSETAIDGYLTYRLIPPSYTAFDEMGIYQRDLSSFSERALYRNVQTSRKQCVNCHTYRQGDPETFLFHKRANDAGTVIAHPKYGLGKHVVQSQFGYAGRGAYPAWHPSGEFIAFSVNETRQAFHLASPQKIEVVDLQSDLVLYSLADRKTTTVESERKVFECFPTWSPDGKLLYTSRAVVDYDVAPSNETVRSENAFKNVERLRYGVVVRSFDAATRAFSEPRTILDPERFKVSFLFPRVSPDGRWLVVTAAAWGGFPIWHNEADLYLCDLATGTIRAIDEINAPGSDSYHGFSSDGRWMVFSSRRTDGVHTHPYITRFDAATGVFSKPFLLPVEDPVAHQRRFLSYNIPEFSTGPVTHSPRELRKVR